ncbi:type II toxin-antitoxin system RelE/ParE family toxin [candidate division WOR-3 bacterium]|nr:type II toxin-antitoxin system RelE/ParE family toxin [candidate division WOR-3 bacterium]
MAYKVTFAPDAASDYRALAARTRAELRDAINRHLVHRPTRLSRSRIKRLRGIRSPMFRLRVGEIRVFYDVRADTVEVLAVVEKRQAEAWLNRHGDRSEESSTGRG